MYAASSYDGLRATSYSTRRVTATKDQRLGVEVIGQLLSYDPTTGNLTWKESPRYGIPAGAVAGSKNARGYLQVMVAGQKHYAHRLAWLLHYGAWPARVIDHINRDKTDNRIDNLRDVSQAVNLQNR
ncbi:MAG: hypothetical protein BGO66_02960 [Alicycliphilus sp. 69-12]|nr:MAG: hypothetical protein BGO66_02960 [Alicycliphilus sp. 69-12]